MRSSIRLIALGLAVGAAIATPHVAHAQIWGGDLSGIPFLQSVEFPPSVSPCLACPTSVCPNRPYGVTLRGAFPNGCYVFKGLQLLPPPPHMDRDPLVPPIIHILVEHRTCQVCTQAPVSWSGSIELPGIPPGNYSQQVRMHVRTVACDSLVASDTTYAGYVPFGVVDSCPPPPPPPPGQRCFFATWTKHLGGCDAFVSPDHPAEVMMKVGTSTPLAGLQGEFRLDPPGLRIAKVEAVGHARGMRLTWNTTPGSVRFVLFAEHGAPIPVTPTPTDGNPILKITAVQPPGTRAPEVTDVTAFNLIAADSLAQDVPGCPFRHLEVYPSAQICAERRCDQNQDGVSDVRDLVAMVRCLTGADRCAGIEDCDGNGEPTLDDVLCCARSILAGGSNDSTGGRPEPDVRLSVGTPVRTGAGVDVPISLRNAHRVGAARLGLVYPDDRYEVVSVEPVGGSNSWLELHVVQDRRLVIGLIGLPTIEESTTQNLEYIVHLALVSGHTPGGDVRIADGEFSGRDGVRLAIEMMQSPVPLGAPSLALSPGRPNPFGRTTHFAVTLANASQGEVAIYDLGGRLVATIARGMLAAGTREYMWNGTDGDGHRAAAGLYLARVRAGSELRSQKLVLLGR